MSDEGRRLLPGDGDEWFLREERRVSASFRAGQPREAGVSEQRGEAVRVLRRRRLGLASRTGARSERARAELLASAVAAAELGETVALSFPEPGEETPALVPTYDAATEVLAASDLVALGREALEWAEELTAGAIVDLEVTARVARTSLENSAGLRHEERMTSLVAAASLTLGVDGQPVRIRAESGGRGPEGVARSAIARAIAWLAPARACSARPVVAARVLFAPEAVATLLGPLVDGLDGMAAVRGLSPLAARRGEPVVDRRLSLCDDGVHPAGLASARRDGEGTPKRSVPLVTAGVLSSFYHDRLSAAAAGCASTACSRRDPHLPSRAPGNWVLAAAAPMPFAALLAEAGEALLVVEVGPPLGGGSAGEFRVPVALGFQLCGGELVGRVRDVMVRGDSYQLLASGLVGAGDDPLWSYGLGFPLLAPSLLVEGVAVGGR